MTDQRRPSRRPDEVCAFTGKLGDENVHVFVSFAADRHDHWRARCVFTDAAGTMTDERCQELERTGPLVISIHRLDRLEFRLSLRAKKKEAA